MFAEKEKNIFSRDNPASAVQWLKNNAVAGRVFNSDNDGGFLIWSGYPILRPFVDGRQLNQENFLMYMRVVSNPEEYWPEVEEEFDFKIIMLDATKSVYNRFIQYIKSQSSWKYAYEDESCIIFLKEASGN